MKLTAMALFKLIGLVMALFLMSCGPLKSQSLNNAFDAASFGTVNPGFAAFQQGFYTHVKTLGCTKCHDSNVNPYFASSNANAAYQNALGSRASSSAKLVDFNNPNSSIFIEYSGNSHCGDTACSDPNNRAITQQHIQNWAQAEISIDDNPSVSTPTTVAYKYITGSMRVPASIPAISATTPAVIRFDLAQLQPAIAGLQNALLEIEIQYVNTNVYRLNRPRIVGATTNLVFSNLKVYMKQVADPSILGLEDLTYTSNWHDVVNQPALVAKPATLPAGPITAATPLVNLPLYYVTSTGTDYFTIGFGDIAPP